MLEKNKKKKLNNLWFGVSILSVVILVFLQAPSVWASPIVDPRTDGVCDTVSGSGVYDLSVGNDNPLFCACNIDLIPEGGTQPVHYVCPTQIYTCSKNNYLVIPTYLNNGEAAYKACVKKIGQPCDNIDQCEIASECKNNQCTLYTGGDDYSGTLGSEVTDIRDTIRTIINIALGFLGVLCVIFILYGGVLWLTSTGNPDKVKKGKDTMIWAALGTIIITIAWTITSYVLHIGEVVG